MLKRSFSYPLKHKKACHALCTAGFYLSEFGFSEFLRFSGLKLHRTSLLHSSLLQKIPSNPTNPNSDYTFGISTSTFSNPISLSFSTVSTTESFFTLPLKISLLSLFRISRCSTRFNGRAPNCVRVETGAA